MPTGKSPLFFDDIRDLLRSALSESTPAGKSVWSVRPSVSEVIYDVEPSGPNASGPIETFRRTYTIDPKTRAVTLGDPEKVTAVTTYETVAPAQFSLSPGVVLGDVVTRPGKLFETGVWPPAPGRLAGFSLDDAEAKAAIGYTVPLEIEHVRSVLDGKLGHATFTAFDGNDLNGVLTLPRALNDLIGPDQPLPVSVVWDVETKTPLRVGLTLNPMITDAAVTAAFSAAEESRKGPAMKPEKPSIWERVFGPASAAAVAHFSADVAADPATLTAAPLNAAVDTKPVTPDPKDAAKDQEIADLKATIAAAEATKVTEAGNAFANEAEAADKITPAAKDAKAAQFSQALRDDAAEAKTAAFSADGKAVEGPRVKALRAEMAALPALGLTGEKLVAKVAEFSAVGGSVPVVKTNSLDPNTVYAERAKATK